MLIYFLNIILIVLLNFLIKDKKKYVITITLILFIVLALRSVDLGVDLPNYSLGYKYISQLNFSEMISKLNFLKTANLIYPFDYESGYVFLNWIISHIGLNFHGFLVVCAFINTLTFGYFIYKYSDLPWLSFFILCTFGTYTYFFGILRQSLALCMLLWSIHFAVNNKKIKSVLLFLIAYLFHRISLIILPLYFFIGKKELKKKNVVFVFALSFPFLLLSDILYSKVIYRFMVFFGKGYIGHGLQLNNLIIMLIFIALIVIMFLNFKKIKNNKIQILSIMALIISIYIETIGLYNDNFARTIQLYNSFLLISIPMLIKQYSNQKYILIIKIIIVIILAIFMFINLNNSVIVPYKFENNNLFIN